MQKLFGLIAAAASLALAAGLVFHPQEAISEPEAPAPLAAAEPLDVPEFDSPLDGISPTQLLFDIAGPASGPELMQGRGPLPPGWKAEPALDLSGPVPPDDQIRAAITRGVDFLLEQQQENGSWDVELTGTLLSETADDAVDAIASTALCGIALRYHATIDPERLEPAIRKAANFVMDRIYRGKLSLKVDYAIWRYALGMKFLHKEFMATTDVEFKEELASITRRMVQSLLKMQLSNNPAVSLERKKKRNLSSRLAKSAMPTTLGVVLSLPTDQAYRGGAPIIAVRPGSAAEKNGLQVGDKIVAAENLRVENAVDFYALECTWLGGQKVDLKVKREGAKDFTRQIALDQTWPGYLGLRMQDGIGTGPQVEAFLRFSPAKGELEIGDVITEMDGVPLKNMADFNAVNDKVMPGKKVKMDILRGGKKKTATISASAAPEGWFGFFPEIEDKGDESGVVIRGDPMQDSSAEKLGLQLGDRITWMGDQPICGLDHYIEYTIPAGRTMKLKWLRNGEEMEADATADAIVTAGDPQFELLWNPSEGPFTTPEVTKLKPGGVSERAGVRNKDVILAINDQGVDIWFEAFILMRQIPAGDDIKIKVRRSTKEMEFTFTLAKYPETTGDDDDKTEEGGWAYYPTMKESPSFCTAFAMLTLQDVQKDILPILAKNLKGPLKSAEKLIAGMRVKDPLAGGHECYVYRAGSLERSLPPTNDKSGVDMRGTQGRNTICELALYNKGKGSRGKSDIKRACDNFIKYRSELDAVRRMEYYATNRGGSPHNFDRWWNAAYYWNFGHYHTLVAAREVGGKTYKEINDVCTKAIMKTRLEDGTWLDHASFGKLVGTSLALWILGETEGGWRTPAGGGTTTQEKSTEKNEEKDKEANPPEKQ